MFYYLKGQLVFTEPTSAVVDCGGVGYKLTISTNTLAKLTSLGEMVCLYTYFYVREDAVELFGFFSLEELSAFKLLISVSGVGPKAAMAVLSVLTPEKFALAVTTGDVKAISKAQGVGGKTAARVVLELKDKVDPLEALAGRGGEAEEAPPALRDAILSLVALGNKAEDARAMAQVAYEKDPKASVQDLIRLALRK